MIKSLYKICQKETESVEEYMLRIHEAVAIPHQPHTEHVSDQRKNLRWDRLNHGILPHLRNVLGFAMADLPEREQADTSFDTLYTLVRRLVSLPASRGPLQDPWMPIKRDIEGIPHPQDRVATLENEDLFPPDPEVLEWEPPELDQLEGLSLCMTQSD